MTSSGERSKFLEKIILPKLVGRPQTALDNFGTIHRLGIGQARMWAMRAMAPKDVPCGLLNAVAVRLTGELDVDCLGEAIRHVTWRHEALRTLIVSANGVAIQAILNTLEVELSLEELTSSADEENRAFEVLNSFWQSPMDLTQNSLWEPLLVKVGGVCSTLALRFHSLLFDAWSSALVVSEIAAAYRALTTRQPQTMPIVGVHMADYVQWKHDQQSAAIDLHLSYWASHLTGAPPICFGDGGDWRPRKSVAGAVFSFTLPSDISEMWQPLVRTSAVTPYMILFSLFAIQVAKYSQNQDLVLGLVGGRGMPQLFRTVGYCANFAPVRVTIRPGTFREVLLGIKAQTLAAQEHHYPHIEDLQERLGIDDPFCRVQFHFNPSGSGTRFGPEPADFGAGLSSESIFPNLDTCCLYEDFIFTVLPSKLRTDIRIVYRRDLVSESFVRRFADDFSSSLAKALANPDFVITIK